MKFNDYFQAVPMLETERLLLRPFTYEDMDDYLEFFADPEVQKYLGGILIPQRGEDYRRWVGNINGRCLKAKLVFTWCVELKAEKMVIGRCDLGGFVRKSMADISYYTSRLYWHMGLTGEAVKRVIQFGFVDLGLHRIQATIMPENTYSLRLLESVGFKNEGLLRMYDFGQSFSDAHMLSMLRSDFPGST